MPPSRTHDTGVTQILKGPWNSTLRENDKTMPMTQTTPGTRLGSERPLPTLFPVPVPVLSGRGEESGFIPPTPAQGERKGSRRRIPTQLGGPRGAVSRAEQRGGVEWDDGRFLGRKLEQTSWVLGNRPRDVLVSRLLLSPRPTRCSSRETEGTGLGLASRAQTRRP